VVELLMKQGRAIPPDLMAAWRIAYRAAHPEDVP